MTTLNSVIWDLDSLPLPARLVGDLRSRKRPPRHWPGDPFLKGPISHAWIASACRLPGVGLHVALAFRFLCDRFQSANRWGLDAIAKGLQVSPVSARRGLHAAEQAGLLDVVRKPGCKLAVSVLNLPESEAGPDRQPLYGPIPWAWLLPALRLPGSALPVAMACWLSAGWERSAEFELGRSEWAELGLSRFSASRGLNELERAGLVIVDRRSGRSPVVTLCDTSEPEPDAVSAKAPNLRPEPADTLEERRCSANGSPPEPPLRALESGGERTSTGWTAITPVPF